MLWSEPQMPPDAIVARQQSKRDRQRLTDVAVDDCDSALVGEVAKNEVLGAVLGGLLLKIWYRCYEGLNGPSGGKETFNVDAA